MHDKQDNLSSFLQLNLKVSVTSKGNALLVDSSELSSHELKRTVRKFIYHQNLNNTYWVDLKTSVVKIKKFKGGKKQKKRKKEGTMPAIITHGW